MKRFLVSMLVSLSAVSLPAQRIPMCNADSRLSSVLNTEAKECDWKPEGYRFSDGSTLPDLRLHYVTLGKPHRSVQGEVDNAILLLHWTGASGASMLTDEFIQNLYAAGKPLDASRYYLIIVDNVGHGKSSKPSDGLRANFPRYTYTDLVDLQHRLVTEALQINRLQAIVGLSMGGMNAWQWVEKYPDSVCAIMPIVALPTRVAGRNLLWRRMVIDWIKSDPAWRDGNYEANPPSLTHAQQLVMLMIEGVPHLQALLPDQSSTDKYINSVAQQASKLDANDLLYSVDSSRDYDPEAGLRQMKTPVFALNFSDDEFNPDSLPLLEKLIAEVPHSRYVVQPGTPSSNGHLSMAHPHLWASHVADFMRFADQETNQR